MNPAIWTGVTSLLDEYLQVRQDDTVVLAYTSDSHESAAWVSAALSMRGIEAARVWMVPLQDEGFHDRLIAALPDPGEVAGRLLLVTFERDTLSHNTAIRNALEGFDIERTLVYRVMSACESLFADALHIPPDELSARNTTILEKCLDAKSLRVTTESGTDLRIGIDAGKYRWISNRGAWRPDSFVVLPAGEVATFPSSIDGVLVADFAFNLNVITEVDARLSERPVTVWIENGRAVRHHCDDATVARFLDECFAEDYAHIVGEVGFGTNVGVVEPIHLNSHINERHPGIHIGFGESNQPPSVVGYSCNIHLDLIARGGVVTIDGGPESLDLQHVQPSQSPHPVHTLDEDATSPDGLTDLGFDNDCCGVLTQDGLKLWRDLYSEPLPS